MANAIPAMSKNTEERLTNLLMQVVNDSEATNDPTAALHKVAVNNQLMPDQIRLMSRAYNTGAALHRFRTGDNTLAKAAAVKLIDDNAIISAMFPTYVDTPAMQQHKRAISDDYTSAPPVVKEYKHTLKLYKLAEGNGGGTGGGNGGDGGNGNDNGDNGNGENDDNGNNGNGDNDDNGNNGNGDNDDSSSKAPAKYSRKRRLQREEDFAKAKLVNASFDSANAINDLRLYFRNSDSLPVDAVKDAASRLFGKAAALIVDAAVENVRLIQRRKSGQTGPIVVNWDKPPFTLIKVAMDTAVRHCQAQKEYNTATRSRKIAEREPRPIIDGCVWDAICKSAEENKMAAGVSGVLGGALVGQSVRRMVNKLQPKTHNQLIDQVVANIGSGGHDVELQGIQTQTMLTDMMANDSVISAYPQEDVSNAFTQLNEVAPRSMQHPVLARSLLRRYLAQEGNIDMFDVNQLLAAERDFDKAQFTTQRLFLDSDKKLTDGSRDEDKA